MLDDTLRCIESECTQVDKCVHLVVLLLVAGIETPKYVFFLLCH